MGLVLFVIWVFISMFLNYGKPSWSFGRATRGFISDVILGGIALAILITLYRWLLWAFS